MTVCQFRSFRNVSSSDIKSVIFFIITHTIDCFRKKYFNDKYNYLIEIKTEQNFSAEILLMLNTNDIQNKEIHTIWLITISITKWHWKNRICITFSNGIIFINRKDFFSPKPIGIKKCSYNWIYSIKLWSKNKWYLVYKLPR